MTPRTDRRATIERRTWRTFLAGLFAPLMFSRRRGERRTGFDRRARSAPMYDADITTREKS
jgi:hypothetical protein